MTVYLIQAKGRLNRRRTKSDLIEEAIAFRLNDLFQKPVRDMTSLEYISWRGAGRPFDGCYRALKTYHNTLQELPVIRNVVYYVW